MAKFEWVGLGQQIQIWDSESSEAREPFQGFTERDWENLEALTGAFCEGQIPAEVLFEAVSEMESRFFYTAMESRKHPRSHFSVIHDNGPELDYDP